MRKGFKIKKLFVMLIFIFFMSISINISASTFSDSIIFKQAENEYIIYFKELTSKDFSFAFTNNNLSNDETLNYILNGKDGENGLSIAYINNTIYNDFFKGKEDTYIWIKSHGEYLYKNYKISLNDSIGQEVINFFKNTTKRIAINCTDKELITEEKDGVKYCSTRGKIIITDNPNAEYSYKLIKYTEESDCAKLINSMDNMEKSSNIIEVLINANEFSKIYNNFLEKEKLNNTWIKLENMQILEPEDCNTGEKYVLWIKKSLDNIEVFDIQILDTYKDCQKEFVKENQVIKTTSKLPVTYDNITLFFVLAIGTGVLIILLIMRKNVKVKDEG